MRKLTATVFLILSFGVLLLFAFTNHKIENLQKINHEIVNDTINLETIDLFGKFTSTKIIDIKKFNDTVFLFTFYQKQDSLYFVTYFMNDGFQFHNVKEITGEMKTDFFDKKLKSMFVVNHNEIILLSRNAITSYDIKRSKIIKNYAFKESESFLSNFSQFDFNETNQIVFSEFIDFSKPKNSFDVIETEVIAGVNLSNNEVLRIPLFVPNDKNFRELSRFQFAKTDNAIIVKFDIYDYFLVYNIQDQIISKVEIPFALQLVPDFDNTELKSNDKMLKINRGSHLSLALKYDKFSKNLVLAFLKVPTDKDDLTDKVYRSKLLFVFDSNLKSKGMIELKDDRFYPIMTFAIDNVVYLVGGSDNSIILKAVTYQV